MAVLVLVTLFATAAFADGDTVLTAVVPTPPTASYELVIPENQTIPYGQGETLIGPVTVVNSQNFTDGKYVTAEVSYVPLKSAEGAQIEYNLRSVKNNSSTSAPLDGNAVIFDNDGEGGVTEYGYIQSSIDDSKYPIDNLGVYISEEKWEAAVPGTYTSTITFTSQIVTP